MSAPQPEQPRIHPRRRPLKIPPPSLSGPSTPDSPPATPRSSCQSNMRLKKGETFHSSNRPLSEDRDPILSFQSLPRRAPTCPRTLEAVALSEQRMVDILSRLNLDSLSDSEDNDNHNHSEDELPVPRGILKAHLGPKANMDPTKRFIKDTGLPSPPIDSPDKIRTDHSHASDSGLGTSVSSIETMPASDNSKVKSGQVSYEFKKPGVSASSETQSAITSSVTAINSTNSQGRQLPLAACKQIERHILVPILKEERLKPFHPLVESIPKRILNKEIRCLRDLEKTIVWLAPQFCASRASWYLSFCEFSVQCIHTTVSHLNERDQRLPTDRPYTNGYFLDLVAQIRQYAAMISRARERTQANGDAPKPGEQAEVSTADEHLTLEGGLSETGRPAELVVHKDGKAISLRTGQPYKEHAVPSFKRTLSNSSVDEGVERSMARRKKNAPPMDINQKCKDCDKVFKRPCDLTKHEKTHSRPWKCTERSCKYYEVGWPTEKERDRHINDKHSKAPALYKCSFAPCTYQSKRESNCKQHMEKAHGWTYVRSKNNGKGSKRGSSVQVTPQTPCIATPISNSVDLPTPVTGPSPSPFEPAIGYPQNPPFSFADPPLPTSSDDFQLFPDNSSFENSRFGEFTTLPTSLDFKAFQDSLETADPNGLIPALDMHRNSLDSSIPDSMGGPLLYNDSPPALTDSNSLNFELDWSHLENQNFEEEYTAMNMQLLTPPGSVEANGMNSFSRDPSVSDPCSFAYGQGKVNSLSPGGQGNLMLYSPHSCHVDDGLSGLHEHGYHDKPGNDFTLYDRNSNFSSGAISMSNASTLSSLRNSNQMFPPLQAQNQSMYMNQAWAGQNGMVGHTNMHPDMDMDFLG